ncbi:putative ABC transport system ATP-binding protein [Pilibacter termitis]|uniref:Putative ABC transport system ATP-binding protein n=1 Tax=Pilibacter termitis TaxID=263852 RepID=A0A1T4N6K2_9ENTE|nr:ABC transporter ATP-binding protein [Pilibacter termitis]SJZ74844.1 putative ABC transport system ATP-binding protein [Pilibacter termitis]
MLLQAKKISKSFGNKYNAIQALKEVDFAVEQGDFVVILGASGGGKTTLLNTLSTLETVDSGEIYYEGRDVQALSEKEKTDFRRKSISFIFQQYHLVAELTVLENIKLGSYLNETKTIDILGLMKQLDIENLKDKYPYELSGGQQQRVAIARALAKNPKILFCDEPTGALDEKTGKSVLGYLEKINAENATTIIMVTHTAGIGEMAKRVIRVNSGQIVEDKKNLSPISASEVYWG